MVATEDGSGRGGGITLHPATVVADKARASAHAVLARAVRIVEPPVSRRAGSVCTRGMRIAPGVRADERGVS